MQRHWLAGVTLALCLAPSPWARPQEPKLGGTWYEDEVDLGFKIKAPRDWTFTPGSPTDPTTIGKYSPPNGEGVSLGGQAAVFVNVWLLRFDNRKSPGQDEEGEQVKEPDPKRVTFGGSKDLQDWIKRGIDKGQGWRFDAKKYPKPLKGVKVPAECFVFDGLSTEVNFGYSGANVSSKDSEPINLYAAVYTLEQDEHGKPTLQVALAGVGPGEKRWRGYEKAFESMAKSFERLEVAASAAPAEGLSSPRTRRRAELEAEMARTPGWKLYETENYFIVSNDPDEAFVSELKERLEAIRKVFLEDYPPEKARLVKRTEPKEEGDDPAAPGSDAPEPTAPDKPVEQRTIAAVNPLDLSRSSVVRVCADVQSYVQYGGSPGAPGYWYSLAEELVLFDDRAGGGKRDTWVVLNHEAFHQYIYYFYGNISPHSWYNEGTGDFYSGYEYKRKRFEPTESPWRIRTAQEMINQGPAAQARGKGEGYAPLQELVRWTQSQYYGSNQYDIPGYRVYAQGWSLIWFLRTGAKNKARGWNPAWNSILDTYLQTLAETGDLDKAVDKAFEGVDWQALEDSWKGYI